MLVRHVSCFVRSRTGYPHAGERRFFEHQEYRQQHQQRRAGKRGRFDVGKDKDGGILRAAEDLVRHLCVCHPFFSMIPFFSDFFCCDTFVVSSFFGLLVFVLYRLFICSIYEYLNMYLFLLIASEAGVVAAK